MNKEVIFYCVYLACGNFKKDFYEVVIDEDTSAEYWLEKITEDLYYKYGYDLVFEWKVFKETPTEAEETNENFLYTVPGRLVFDDDFNYLLLKQKAENYDLIREIQLINPKQENSRIFKQEKIIEKKDYESCWINKSGEKFIVGFADHEEWAWDYLKEHDKELFDEYGIMKEHDYAHLVLEDMGWIRILGWKDPPSFVLPVHITPKQKQALRDYCMKNSVSYQYYPEILKS